MMRPRRRRQGGFGLVLLFMQLARFGFNHIPPTTLITIGLNVAVYLKVLNKFLYSLIGKPSIQRVCVSAVSVWYRGDWSRLLLAAWFHLDDWHLYYNMISFLWKGRFLEQLIGSYYFAYLIAVFSVVTNIVMIGINIMAAEFLEDDSYILSCAAGFSGVIFALKVVTTHLMPNHRQSIMGIFSVPSQWACWVELVLIQVLVPRASFTGHLAGILVGLAYIKGPLKGIMDSIAGTFTEFGGSARRNYRRSNTRRWSGGDHNPAGQTSGYRPRAQTPGNGFREETYTGGMSEDEQVAAAMRQSQETATYTNLYPSAPPVEEEHGYENVSSPTLPPYGHDSGQSGHQSGISNEELRRRRLERLNQR
ncbi:rhomboid-related protein 4-like [Anneissia japonica]|uniref:rhomboid-related protein 4-like n=1 Tax=Anneissia japonica TaxID=1529436 RepID=UPI00142592E6|nr:rhomboid-related protein 4-like [Anneissia japonica]